MKTYNFRQFNSITEFSKKFNTQKKCIRFLEKELWGDKMPTSPFDPTSKVYKRGDGLYRCKNTGKNFSIISNTFMGGTKIGLPKWFYAIYMQTTHKKGISSLQLSKDIEVTQKTAWFMLHRIRQAFQQDANEKFYGEVELDETFVGGKNKNRHSNKKVKKCQGRSFKDKIPVLGILEQKWKSIL